jgi:hypothetical protein
MKRRARRSPWICGTSILMAVAQASAGTIAGTVATSTSQPITDGFVRIYAAGGTYLGLASIDNSGHYSYGGLAAGNYFAVTTDTGYFDELWDNKPCAQGACTITTGTAIAVGSGTTAANFVLASGGTIAGSVTASAGGQAITDGFVKIYGATGAYLGLTSVDNSGHYSYGGLAAGNYFAVTTDTGYFDELWDNKPCAQGACTVTSGTPIIVGASGTTTANFSLASGGAIAGSVTASAGGQPITDGFVKVYGATGTYLGLTSIDNTGHYGYGGLAAGTYFAVTSGTGFNDELWDNKPCAQGACTVTSGTPVVVGASGMTTANFSLSSGGSIAGTVTTSTSHPVTDGFVKIYGAGGAYLGLASIDNTGHYSYDGLAAGSYFAATTDTGLLDELWDNKPCPQGVCTITLGTPITVGAGATTANFILADGGAIAGNVTASANGQPVTDGFVKIYAASGAYLGLTTINNSGHFSYGGLAAGNYFAVTSDTGFNDELWDNKPCAQGACTISSGTLIPVSGTAATTANFQLAGSTDLIFRSGFETKTQMQFSAHTIDALRRSNDKGASPGVRNRPEPGFGPKGRRRS